MVAKPSANGNPNEEHEHQSKQRQEGIVTLSGDMKKVYSRPSVWIAKWEYSGVYFVFKSEVDSNYIQSH